MLEVIDAVLFSNCTSGRGYIYNCIRIWNLRTSWFLRTRGKP